MREPRTAAPSAALPAGTATRWVKHRKGAVVAAVRAGVVVLYALSAEELAS